MTHSDPRSAAPGPQDQPIEAQAAAAPTPSKFMRGRRPALFSDSRHESTAPQTRDEFEYRLETITSRSEEALFQRFGHALLEAEVCPNLIPQTGPTGGGDSKVDADTYPVADALAERWWRGTAREAANEDWAFAISAMKDWRKKGRSDVDNVLASGRNYQRIFFLTNQFVKDKDRAKLEKELTKRAGGIPVRIFDRTWIVQAVFDHERWPIAARELNLPAAKAKSPGMIGPRDAERARELADVDAEIHDPGRFADSQLQLAHAFQTSALLARGLDRPREEVDQRFDRAIELASQSGSSRAQRRMRYQKAWTDFWWYDDSQTVIGAYDAIEALLDDDINAWDVEQLVNLYSLLISAERHGWLPAGAAGLPARFERLRAHAKRLAGRKAHPTDAAWARTHLCHLDFLADPANPEQHVATIKALQGLLRDVERLPEYPVESLCEVINVLTQFPIAIEGLDAVADRAGELVGKRLGAQAQARQLLERAIHKAESKAPEEALRLLGRAMGLLHRQPSRSLYLAGAWTAAQAYCDIGLYCAARAHLLLGLSRSLRSVVEDARMSDDSLEFAVRLAWVELAAGRLPLMLEALHLADMIASALDLSGKQGEAYLNERLAIEAMLARAIANSTPEHAPAMAAVPAMLAERRLEAAQQTTLALLGHSEEPLLRMTEGMSLAAIQAAPWPEELGPIDWESAVSGDVRSRVMGCELRATGVTTQEARSLILAIFAAVEAFAATAFADRFTPIHDRLAFSVVNDPAARSMTVQLVEDDCGDPVVRVNYAFGSLAAGYASTKEFHARAAEAVANILARVCVPTDRTAVERLFSKDAVQDRAFALLNACGLDEMSSDSPALEALVPENAELADLVGTGRFLAPPGDDPHADLWDARLSAEKPPPGGLAVHHHRTRMLGVINTPLWDRAHWRGVGFTIAADGVPEIGLLFRDEEAAEKILRGLHRRVGRATPDALLRIAILTDVDRNNRAAYRMGIAPMDSRAMQGPTQTLMVAFQITTMAPQSANNLNGFLGAFARAGRFRIGVAVAVHGPDVPARALQVAPLEFTELSIKPAWQVQMNEPMFGMMLQTADQIYIPEEIEDPEQLPAVQMITSRKATRR